MNEYPHIYRPSLLLRLFTSTFPGIWGAGVLWLTIQSAYAHYGLASTADMAFVIFFALLSLGALALSAFLFTEVVEIGPIFLARRSIFGMQRILIGEVVEAKCVKFGRGNTLLRVRTKTRTMRMASIFRTADIESMAAEILRLSQEHK